MRVSQARVVAANVAETIIRIIKDCIGASPRVTGLLYNTKWTVLCNIKLRGWLILD